MNKLIFILLLFSSCSISLQLGNKKQNNKSNIIASSLLINYELDLLYHDSKCEYAVIHSFDVKKGETLNTFIESQYLDIEIKIHEFSYFMRGQYFYSNRKICLDPYIKEAFEKFKIYNDNL